MMNIRVIQPPYPKRVEDTPASVAFMIDELRRCDEKLDLILLPECCNAPSGCGDSSLLPLLVAEHTDALLSAAKETAIRCKATVGINLYVYGKGYETAVRNATLLFNSRGELAAQYDKQHLPASEYTNASIDHSYLTESVNPFCVEVDGVRYAFLTCYDMYYTEFIHRISLEKPDVVLICSLQRAERADILEMQGKNAAFVCNSYVVRSSYHMGYESGTGGNSMVVAPDGVVLHNFGQELGSFDCQVEDIHWKYRRSNGYGQPEVTNDVYQTLYRTPWCYRVGGSGVRPGNDEMAFPRLCAHRGFAPAVPENTIVSIGMAVALGASEVEIDVRTTADGVPVISHDPDVRRLTGENGVIHEMKCADLQKLNVGIRYAPHYDGIGYATLEEVFAAFPRRTVFNLHIQQEPGTEDYRPLIRKIRQLAQRYDCAGHYYLSSESAEILTAAAMEAPDAERCLICQENGPYIPNLMEEAEKLRCSRIQTIGNYLTDDQLQRAKAAKIRCNLFSEDGVEEAGIWFEKGVDCILTDNYLALHAGVETY